MTLSFPALIAWLLFSCVVGGSDPRVLTEDKLWFFSHVLAGLAPHQRTTAAEIVRHLAIASNGAILWTEAQCRTAMHKLNYSKKHFTNIAIQRYTPWNLVRNAQFMEYRLQVPPEFLGFFDESGWEKGVTGNPNSGWGDRFERLINVSYKKMKGIHHNLSVLASVDSVVHYEFVKGSYKAANVVEFFENASLVLRCSRIRYIQMDNARIHNEEVVEKIRSLVNADGIHLDVLFQPTYSPHLNPVELIFGYLKKEAAHHYRALQDYTEVLLNQLIYEKHSSKSIPRETLKKFAWHCEVY